MFCCLSFLSAEEERSLSESQSWLLHSLHPIQSRLATCNWAIAPAGCTLRFSLDGEGLGEVAEKTKCQGWMRWWSQRKRHKLNNHEPLMFLKNPGDWRRPRNLHPTPSCVVDFLMAVSFLDLRVCWIQPFCPEKHEATRRYFNYFASTQKKCLLIGFFYLERSPVVKGILDVPGIPATHRCASHGSCWAEVTV